MVGISVLSAFNTQMAKAIPLSSDWCDIPLPYQMTKNPVSYYIGELDDVAEYRSFTGYQSNGFARYYDPESRSDSYLALDFIKNIDQRTIARGGVKYNHTDLFKLNSTLEKDHYANYFSLIDSTKGNTKYGGPQLWMSLNRQILDRFIIGVNLDYGVERSLKHRYTECETIVRNSTIGGGIAYLSNSKGFSTGINVNYINRQDYFEPYGEYTSAIVYHFNGFNVLSEPFIAKTPEKWEFIEGVDLEYFLYKKDLILAGVDFSIITNSYQKDTEVKVGGNKRRPAGYWAREGKRFAGAIDYQPVNGKFNGRLLLEQRSVFDWARSADYAAVSLENNEAITRLGSLINYQAGQSWSIYSKIELENRDIEYYEYINPFEFVDQLASSTYSLGLKGRSGLLSSVHFEGSIGRQELDFHWVADELQFWGLRVGVERQYAFGLLGVETNLSVSTPTDEEISGAIQNAGIGLYVKR